MNYPNGQCDGLGVATPGALSRTFWFQPQRSEFGEGLAVFWGNTQAFPYGHLLAPVWTRVALVRKANVRLLWRKLEGGAAGSTS